MPEPGSEAPEASCLYAALAVRFSLTLPLEPDQRRADDADNRHRDREFFKQDDQHGEPPTREEMVTGPRPGPATVDQPGPARSSSGGLRSMIGSCLVLCSKANAIVPQIAGTHSEIAW